MENGFHDPDIPTAEDVDELYGSKYLTAVVLDDQRLKTRIAKVTKEPMQKDGKPDRPKLVLYFTSNIKPLPLNATNKSVLVEKLGKPPIGWLGAEVGLCTEPTSMSGKATRGVRLTVLSAPKAAPTPAPQPAPAPKPAPVATVADDGGWDPQDPGPTGDDFADFGEAAE